jgi:ABC-2 type transport system ATP-binding protein
MSTPTPPDAAIRVEGVRKSFGAVDVLDGVDLTVTPGRVTALLGPNGAGKTTLVRIISTLLRPDAGTVAVAGHDVVRDPGAVRRAISVTGQDVAVDEMLTGEENLRLVARLSRLDRATARRRTSELIERFDLAGVAGRPVGAWSGGTRRRLDLALGLVANRPVLLLDEPTTGLDPAARLALWAVIEGLVADGTTVLLTTQYLEEADRLADHLAVIDRGRIVAEGTAADLKRRVPGERLDLTMAGPEAFARGRALLGDRVARVDAAQQVISVGGDGTAASVRRVLDHLEGHGVEVARLALHQPTLDDVFLLLTGPADGLRGPNAEPGTERVA